MNIKHILIILVVLIGIMSNKPTDYDKRTVHLSNKNTIIKAEISLTKTIKTKKLNENLEYSWFYNNSIKTSKGNFSGRLLDGKYEVYDLKNNLLTKGQYDLGLKQDKWYYWYANGMLKTIIDYKNGYIHGKSVDFKQDNNNKSISTFRKNKLKKIIVLENNHLISKTKFDNKGDTIFRKKIFPLFNKEQDTIIIESNNIIEQDSTKQSFWQKLNIFKKDEI